MASKLALLTLFADLLEPAIAQSASATFAPTFTFDAWVQHATLNADAGCVIQNIVNVASANACLAYTATGYTAVEFVSNAFCYCWSGSCTSANVVFNQAQTASVYIPTPPTPSYSPTASMTVSMTPTKLATMSFTPTHAGSSTASPTPSHLSPGTASPSSSSSAYPPTASATFVPPSFQYDTWLRFARLGGNGCNLAAYSLDATSAADCLANYSAGYAAVEYFQPFCESYTGSCTAANVVFDQTAWNEYVYVPSPPTPSHTPSVTPTASATFAPTFVYDTWMQYAAISSGDNCYMVSGTNGLTAAECLANYSGYTALNYDDFLGGYCWPFAGSCTAANVAFDQAASYSYIYVPTPPSESSTPSNSPTPSHTPSNLATPSHTPSNLPTPTSTFAPAFAYNTWVQYAALAHVVGCDYAGAVGGTTADACLDYIAAGYVAVASAGSFCQYFTGNCTAADVVFFSYASYEFLYIRAPPTATSTPSSSPAGTSSSSCTSSSSATVTASSTNTPPATVPASGSGTPSATSPASVSSTPSRSHSLSATRTSTPSRTKPPGPSKSGSKSASPSKTSSRSAKVTSTPTRSATRSKTRASTPSPTRSRSATRKLKAL